MTDYTPLQRPKLNDGIAPSPAAAVAEPTEEGELDLGDDLHEAFAGDDGDEVDGDLVPAAALDEDFEEGELDPATAPPPAPAPAPAAKKSRKRDTSDTGRKGSASKKQKRDRDAAPTQPNALPPAEDDFWDDTELIAAWDRAMDRERRRKRGEPMSDSEDEDLDDGAGYEENEAAAEPAAAPEALAATTAESYAYPSPFSAAAATANPQAAPFMTRQQLIDSVTAHSYWAGYYAGLLAGRTSAEE
ncbi:hypothetical protein H9P43_005366 [Blastocladiella emersonii ATCC 22665]|nr:hypothetical protein H9P43_005366 [Blastocladiella emersonii ATCC 22665]